MIFARLRWFYVNSIDLTRDLLIQSLTFESGRPAPTILNLTERETFQIQPNQEKEKKNTIKKERKKERRLVKSTFLPFFWLSLFYGPARASICVSSRSSSVRGSRIMMTSKGQDQVYFENFSSPPPSFALKLKRFFPN